MADAPVLGGRATVALDPTAFGARFNGPLLHELVRAELAARRRGTAATRTRRAVSGGNSKPWRQKGTGRARAGSTRAPNFTGGGIVFGPHPRSYTFKVNRKERRAALRSALSLHAQRGSIAIVDTAAFTEPSTKAAATLLAGWDQPGATLVVVSADEREAGLSFRNIERVSVLTPENVGVADIVGAAALLCSSGALEALTARALGAPEMATGAATPVTAEVAETSNADAEPDAVAAEVEGDAAAALVEDEAPQAVAEDEAPAAVAEDEAPEAAVEVEVESPAAEDEAPAAGLDAETPAAEAEDGGASEAEQQED
jgi:large subunit ribosomal protein L4